MFRRFVGALMVTFCTIEIVFAEDFQTLDSGTIDRAVNSGREAIEINASTDASQAAIRLDNTASWTSGKFKKFSTTTATISAPIDKSDNVTDFATLDGLANSSSIELKYSQVIASGLTSPTDGDALRRIEQAVYRGCVAKLQCKDALDAEKKFKGELPSERGGAIADRCSNLCRRVLR